MWRVGIDETSGEVLGPAYPVTAGAGSIRHATLSADGRKIAFAAPLDMSQIERYDFDPETERVAGPPKTVFASTKRLSQFDVTKDGRRLAFRTEPPREDIVVMNIDGTGRRRLMDDTHKDRGPAWTSDGKLLLFYSNRGGAYDIWRIRPDGTDAQRLTNSNSLTTTNGIPAPDGRSFACTTLRGSGFSMMLYKPNQTLESLSAPLPAPESGVTGFSPAAFSPHGKYIAGMLVDNMIPVVSVYSCETQNVTRIKAADLLIETPDVSSRRHSKQRMT